MATIKDVRMGLWVGVTEAMANHDFISMRKRLDVLRSNIQDEEPAWSELMAFEAKLEKESAKRLAVINSTARYANLNPLQKAQAKTADTYAFELWCARKIYYFWSKLVGAHKLVSGAS